MRGLTGAIDGRRLRVIHGRWACGCYSSRNSEVVALETVKWSPSAIPLPSFSGNPYPGWGWAVGGDWATGRFCCFRSRSNTSLLLCTWRMSASGPPARDPSTRFLTQRCCFYVHLPGSHCLLFSVHRCVCVCLCVRARAGACSSVGCHRRYSEENSQGSSGPSVITSMQRMRVLTCLKFALTHFGGE